MVYFRFYYSNEWGEEFSEDHPIVEIPKEKTTVESIDDVVQHLKIILQPDVLKKCELRFMKK